MKKYLFLLFLFIIYIVLTISNKSMPALSYNDINNKGMIEYEISFKDGINSNKVIDLFNNYKDEYYINLIKLKNNTSYKLSCDNIKICINYIYKNESYDFNIKYLTSGFNISSVNLISYNLDVKSIFDDKNIEYTIKLKES